MLPSDELAGLMIGIGLLIAGGVVTTIIGHIVKSWLWPDSGEGTERHTCDPHARRPSCSEAHVASPPVVADSRPVSRGRITRRRRKPFVLIILVTVVCLLFLMFAPQFPGWIARWRGADLTNSVFMDFRRIEAGEFTMGSDSASGLDVDETPAHLVRITKPFYIGMYEVTERQFALVMGTQPPSADAGDLPVAVTLQEANEFCQRLSQMSQERAQGRQYRLPTEAEWEYACRAGTTTPHSFGFGTLDDYAWYANNSGGTSRAVGKKRANAWGLFDMHGNLWEWCEDIHSATFYGISPTNDPIQASGMPTNARVVRGGSYHDLAHELRSANRSSVAGQYLSSNPKESKRFGFRVVIAPPTILTPPEPTE